MAESPSETGRDALVERERFLFRISQIAALALILSVSAITFALINFVGLSPVFGDIERRLDEIETASASRLYDRLQTAVRAQTEEVVARQLSSGGWVRSDVAGSGAASPGVEEAFRSIDGAARTLTDEERARVRALADELEAILAPRADRAAHPAADAPGAGASPGDAAGPAGLD